MILPRSLGKVIIDILKDRLKDKITKEAAKEVAKKVAKKAGKYIAIEGGKKVFNKLTDKVLEDKDLTFQEKLEMLEQMKKEGKISEEEYKMARQALMQTFPSHKV